MHQFADRRLSFGSIAEQYDAVRPDYPQPVINTVLDFAGTGPGGRVLEIGAGTGQATAQLAAAGLNVLAVEPSAEMAEVMRQRFSEPLSGGAVEVQVSDFETAQFPDGEFDLVFAATVWHWLTERVRWELTLRALKPGATVAAIWHWPLWRRSSLRPELDAVYLQSGADLSQMGALLEVEPTIQALGGEWLVDAPSPDAVTDACGLEQLWSDSYSAAEYVALINTYADHIALTPEIRERLDNAVGEVIERGGGTITLPYKTLVVMARKR